MVHVKDNFLDKEFFNKIVDEFISPHIPYYLQHGLLRTMFRKNKSEEVYTMEELYFL